MNLACKFLAVCVAASAFAIAPAAAAEATHMTVRPAKDPSTHMTMVPDKRFISI